MVSWLSCCVSRGSSRTQQWSPVSEECPVWTCPAVIFDCYIQLCDVVSAWDTGARAMRLEWSRWRGKGKKCVVSFGLQEIDPALQSLKGGLEAAPSNPWAKIKIISFSYYSICTVGVTDGTRPPQIEKTVLAEYELEHLLLEGHCFDVMTEQPPRGLQFTLGTKRQPVAIDTIVMANLVSVINT